MGGAGEGEAAAAEDAAQSEQDEEAMKGMQEEMELPQDLVDAIMEKLTVDMVFFGSSSKIDFNYYPFLYLGFQ